jgi:hypothetical protein
MAVRTSAAGEWIAWRLQVLHTHTNAAGSRSVIVATRILLSGFRRWAHIPY